MVKKDFQQVDLVCLLQQDKTITRRPINGNLCLNGQGSLKFEQTVSTGICYERNPHLFEGNYVNIGRNKSGELIVNFRKIKEDESTFNVAEFCMGVYNELLNELPTIVNQ